MSSGDAPRKGQNDRRGIWFDRKRALIDQASFMVESEEVSPLLSAAMQCERIENGEADPDTMDGYPWHELGEEFADEGVCTCTPEQRASGGFKSTCEVHGV